MRFLIGDEDPSPPPSPRDRGEGVWLPLPHQRERVGVRAGARRQPVGDLSSTPLARTGVLLLHGVVPAGLCAHWLALIDRRYAMPGRGAINASDYSVHSSSLRLRAVPEIALAAAWRAIGHGELRRALESALGARLACDADECWIRRQYAIGNYPPLHAPHGWHQDGALRFDFLGRGVDLSAPDALLDMATCWIALSACGGTEAPGLELIARRLPGLLEPAELTHAHLSASFAAADFCRPQMAPGDALLLRGDVLHRSHLTPAMRCDRTSLELRVFPANLLPARLAGDLMTPLV